MDLLPWVTAAGSEIDSEHEQTLYEGNNYDVLKLTRGKMAAREQIVRMSSRTSPTAKVM